MKHFRFFQWPLIVLLFVSMPLSVLGQTQLGLGDLAFVYFRQPFQSENARYGFLSRTFIDAGTEIFITNSDYSNSNQTFSYSANNQNGNNQAIIQITTTEPISPGQVFLIEFTSTGGSSTVVSDEVSAAYFSTGPSFVEFDFSHNSNIKKLWVYQMNNSAINFITGVLWSGTTNLGGNVPNVLVFPPTANSTAVDLNISGASEKCGCWSPFSTPANTTSPINQINLSDPLNQTFYDRTKWVNGNQSTDAACVGTIFLNTISNPANIVFDRYRYGHPADGASPRWTGGTASDDPNSVWTDLPSAPDWASETAVRRVEIHENYTLSGQRTFTCASLLIASGKTLTLEPGAILAVGQTLDNDGTIHCKSGMVGSPLVKQFAQIAPTNAQLNGTYIYDVLINNPEWHHFMSPIVSTLGNIQFIDPSNNNQSSTFTLSYTGPTANVYRWDAADAQWKLTTGANADFHAEPYTIFFPQSELPLFMRVTGELVLTDQNDEIQRDVINGQGIPADPGFGAPGWNVSNVNGWNFYGNPYLSFISTERTTTNFQNDMSDISHSVYAYQPFRNSSVNIANNYYTFNGSTGDDQANNIPPFQAFFMQHVNPGSAQSGSNAPTNNNGVKLGKRSRLSQNPTAGSFVQFRTTSTAKTKLALELYHQTPNPEATLYLDLRDDMQQVERNIYKDAVFNGDVHKMFGIYFDSSCYVIKCAPNHLDSLHQKVAMVYRNHGASFSIANHPDFNTDYESFLYDRYTSTMHNLSQGAYSFVNDTTQQDYRFDWFLAPKHLGIFRAFEQAAPSWVWWSAVDNTVALFTQAKRQDEKGHVMVFDLNGKMMFEQTGVIHQMRLPAQSSGKQAIVVINREKAIKIQFP